jgi:hypothetical protein
MTLPYADWFDLEAREIYYKLWEKPAESRTKEENDFMTRMYHAEEYACGLDGI